jgi:CRP/FNR family transcriptional regulator
MAGLHKLLLSTFLFNSFTEREIALLSPSLSLKKVRRGEQIFSEGLEATAFFVVISGKIKVYKLSPDGKEHTLHIQGPGDLVAEAANCEPAPESRYRLCTTLTCLSLREPEGFVAI